MSGASGAGGRQRQARDHAGHRDRRAAALVARPLDGQLLDGAGLEGPAFLVTRNFDAVYSYNAAESYGLAIALRTRSHFGRLLAFGITMNIFLYFFINTAMVMGLIPVVGIPLPLSHKLRK